MQGVLGLIVASNQGVIYKSTLDVSAQNCQAACPASCSELTQQFHAAGKPDTAVHKHDTRLNWVSQEHGQRLGPSGVVLHGIADVGYHLQSTSNMCQQ